SFIGIFWFLLSLIFCNGGDILIKMIGTELSYFQVSFFRFLFSCILLVPVILIKGIKFFYTRHYMAHSLRALILVFATSFWIKAVPSVDLAIATFIGLSTPLFILPISCVWLKEKVSRDKIFVTVLGLCSLVLALEPSLSKLNPSCAWLIFSVMLYGFLDVFNKIYAQKETILNLLFYSSFFGTLFSFPGAFSDWKPLYIKDLALLLVF